MIETILPPGVHGVATTQTRPLDPRFEDEARHVDQAVPRRRDEFLAGRWCARAAMRALGQDAVAIGVDRHGAPVWPRGVIGSITHCPGYCAAAVARADRIVSLGIDAEPNLPLPDGLVDVITEAEERAQFAELDDRARIAWDRMLFSAKESAYKLWYPLGGRLLGFDDVHVTIDPRGTWLAHVLVTDRPVPSPGESLAGRWHVADGLILTSAWLTRVSRIVESPPGPGTFPAAAKASRVGAPMSQPAPFH